jgi:type VI secretion system protein ImpH
MAAPGGPATHPLEQRLQEKPAEFDFFQAVRRIECTPGGHSRIGASEHPREDPIRICQATSIAFNPSAVSEYVPKDEKHPARLFVNFMGMLGTNGPLPLSVTEYVYDRIHNAGDPTFARFLDLFNHRMISLFYRAWASAQQTVSRDSRANPTWDRYVGSLFGVGTEAFRGGDEFPDEAKLHYAGHLSCETKHPEGLASIVGAYFGVEAKVIEFIGRWLPIPEDCLCLMGSPSARLGLSAMVGSHMWECQQKFRIRLGPMGLSDYERLLAHKPSFRRLIAMVRTYIGDELLYDVQIILRADEVPRMRLGGYGRLGWTTWLGQRSLESDADDLVVHESRIDMLKAR